MSKTLVSASLIACQQLLFLVGVSKNGAVRPRIEEGQLEHCCCGGSLSAVELQKRNCTVIDADSANLCFY